MIKNKNKKITRLYFIGRLTFQKNIINLLDDFSSLYKNDKYISLTIIGDGEFKNDIKKYLKYKNIFYKGFKKKPWENIQKDGIIIVPSYWEEPGHVPIEAFLNNKRFFISEGCSLSDFIHKDCKDKIVFSINNMKSTLKNIKILSDEISWYNDFDKLNESFSKFTVKSFREALDEI